MVSRIIFSASECTPSYNSWGRVRSDKYFIAIITQKRKQKRIFFTNFTKFLFIHKGYDFYTRRYQKQLKITVSKVVGSFAGNRFFQDTSMALFCLPMTCAIIDQ